jgi:hypothetical protein
VGFNSYRSSEIIERRVPVIVTPMWGEKKILPTQWRRLGRLNTPLVDFGQVSFFAGLRTMSDDKPVGGRFFEPE